MKARMESSEYLVDQGWEIVERKDEQFDSGFLTLESLRIKPFSAYTYAELVEDRSFLNFNDVDPVVASKVLNTGDRVIKTIYMDIDIKDVTKTFNIIDRSVGAGGDDFIIIDNLRLILNSKASGAQQQSNTSTVLEVGRQIIVIALIGSSVEVFVNGIKQPLLPIPAFPLVTAMDIANFDVGSAIDNSYFELYDFRLSAVEFTEIEMLALANSVIDVNKLMTPGTTDIIFNEFEDFVTIINKGYYSNQDMTGINVTGELVKKYFMYTQDAESTWYDRELGVWKHQMPMIELTEYIVHITTPVIRFTQPLDGITLNYPTLKTMVDRVYNVMFTEIDGVNNGWDYTDELLDILENTPGFDYVFPESNGFNVLSYIFNVFEGIPRIVEIINGKILLGVDFKNKEENEIEFNDFDSIKVYNLAKDYGTMGESRGLNLVINGEDANDSSYMYTKETILSVRSVGTVIDENDMVHEIFYPIKGIKNIQFYDLNNLANTVDITRFAVTESVYKLLPTNGFVSGTTDLYKQNTIRYNINGDLLFGWGVTFNRFILPSFVVWKELIKSAQNYASIPVNIPSGFQNVAINMNYVTILNQSLVRVAKENIKTVKRSSVLSTNQGGNIVDIKRLGQNLHSDIQRSGNRVYEYGKRDNKSIYDLYNIGDYDLLTNALITVKKTIGYQDFYFGHYALHEDYQKITTNLDIAAKIREFNIPKDGKAIESARFYEDFVEWNLEGIETNTSSFTVDGIKAFLQTFGEPSGLAKFEIDNVEMISDDIVDEFDVPRSLVIPIVSSGYRNTLKFFFGFKDPTFAYSRKVTDGSLEVKQGIRYTNDEGFLDELTLNYGKKYAATAKGDVDNLPIAVGGSFSGNPLITIGASQTLLQNYPIPQRSRGGKIGLQFNFFDAWDVFIKNGVSSTTKDVELMFNDSLSEGVVTYDVLRVFLFGVDSLDNIIDIGQFNITPNELLTIPINDNYKSITFDFAIEANFSIIGAEYLYVLNSSYNQETVTSGNGIKLEKDAGEILLLSHFAHNVFYQQTLEDIGNIVIGDEAMIGNIMVGGATKDKTFELFLYESERYGKYERTNIKGTQKSTVDVGITFGTKSIELNGAVPIADGKSWAIGDDSGRLLFAVNPPRPINGVLQPARDKVSFNFVHFRTGLIREY